MGSNSKTLWIITAYYPAADKWGMGIYVNPGNAVFRKAINDDIYVDKTNLIVYTNSRIDKMNCFVCASRPRRFGKSMAADMLTAYYSKGCDSGKLFAGRNVEKDQSFMQHLNKHNVIHLDIQKILLVGIAYDKKKKSHECMIEKYVKDKCLKR